jgi:hypothetical protein
LRQALYIGIVLLLYGKFFQQIRTQLHIGLARTIVRQDVFASAYDAAYILTSPFHFNMNDWLTAGGVSAGTAVIFPLDQPVRNFMKEQHGSAIDQIMSVGRWYGTGMM